MKTIIVATDFSPASVNAAEYAAEMALTINADILLLHVYQIPVVYLEVPVAMNEVTILQEAEKQMTEIKERLKLNTVNKVAIDTLVVEGVFFHELKTVCERIKPYAVVMGSQGTTAAERLFLGGHTVYAMKHLMWPIITVPPEVKFSSIKYIGLACDFDKVTRAVPAHEIETLVNDFHAELHILNTGKQRMYNPELIFESGVLKEMLANSKPYYHFIANDNTDEGIIDFAERNHIDLLIILPKRHDLLDKMIHKSHTRNMVLYSHVPVMALHH